MKRIVLMYALVMLLRSASGEMSFGRVIPFTLSSQMKGCNSPFLVVSTLVSFLRYLQVRTFLVSPRS
jgi:hypothetical protein